jgi:FMN reductase
MAQHSTSRNQIRVVAVNGSLREASYTRLALQIALDGARAVGAETQLLDLRDYDLVFCDGRRAEVNPYPEGVQRLQNDVRRAQGIILGTPEYHGSMSGVLKNALDLMGFEEFEGKIVGLVSVSGGKLGGINALNSLRVIGRALHAWVVPEQASIPQVSNMFDEAGQITNERLHEMLLTVGRQVARFAFLHTSTEIQAFLRAWEGAPDNPGAGDPASWPS